ncbi:MAG: hypothetical protein LJE69_01455 [Thiohalocapsa sp.]|jgi:uncharacterized protein (DUF697 family)|uniref:hypothetical protein n=1 Tax=Thiohalocapsa sp. TaxID=2497641 RepID=UPI0025EC730D|nr:hypothetical protein [Thiohalocapsa sp.]MCG6939903.1 hypothetical protein [Thiohalocapsa sp.]
MTANDGNTSDQPEDRAAHSLGHRQSLAAEEFFYFFLRLRKNEIRRTVRTLEEQYPEDDLRQRARRLVDAKTGLAALGGGLLYVPGLFPAAGQFLTFAGVVGAASILTRMHLYLILEIACVYGEDIDDLARVPEMVAVIAATGMGATAPQLLAGYKLGPMVSVGAGALSMAAVTRLIGFAATRFYAGRHSAEAAAPEAQPEPAAG